uniref:CASP-like protein n=1 Tax=Noccaea caerulescens TaxID=107243 RepID=A0A1J3E313_NOCCA
MAPPPPSPPPPPPSPPPVSLKVLLLLLRVLTGAFLVITVIILSTNSVTIESEGNALKIHFKDVYAYRYMFSAAVIGLLYAVIQLFFTISEFATAMKNPFNYQLDFYGDKIISYVAVTGSAAGFGVSKDLKDAFIALVALDSTEPVDNFFSRGYASASMLLFAFLCLAVLSVFSSHAIAKRQFN